MMTRPAAVLLLAAASAAAQSPAPSPSARPAPGVTFAVEVNYVEVDAIVTDRAGNPVRDLEASEFVVLEDGKPQTIDLFTKVDIPYERPEPLAPPPVQPDVRNNLRPFEGRVYVIVLDGLHTHVSRTSLVRAAARQFLERHFAEGDMAAVVHTFGGSSVGQELTGDRRLLLESVDRFVGRKLPSPTLSRIDAYRRSDPITRQGRERVEDPELRQRGHNARAALDTLESVADWLSAIRGRRKAVLYISEGIEMDLTDAIYNQEASPVLSAMRDATAAAVRSNVSFYSIDPRGLGGLSAESMEIQPVFDDPALGLTPQGLDSELRNSQQSLRTLADETSGLAAVNTNDFQVAFTRMVKDNSAYYVLGYYPPGPHREGRHHRLEVRVTRPGVRVRARSGYTEHKRGPRPPDLTVQGTPAVLGALLNSALPRPGLPMEVQAAAFAGEGKKASVVVAVELEGRGFRFQEKDGVFHDTLELSFLAVDAQGSVHGTNQKVQLDLKPRTKQMVEAAGFRVLHAMDLEPGRYQLRVAGRTVNSGQTGSVFYDLAIPEFTKEKLSLSGVVVSSTTAGLVPTAGAVPLLQDVLPGPPTTIRRFFPFDRLALVAEIYDREAAAHTLDVVTTLTGAEGTVAWRSAEERAIAARRGKDALLPVVHALEVPMDVVPPGTYTLRVAVTSRMGRNPPTADRALVVEVMPRPPANPAPPPGL